MKICTLFRLLFPMHTLKKNCRGEIFTRKSYTYFCYAGQSFLSTYLLLALDYKMKIGIEDGLANYVGNPLVDQMSNSLKFVDKVLFHRVLSEPFVKLYLNNPKNYKINSITEVCKLPTLDIDTIELLKKVFHYNHNTIYDNIGLIYLAQPKEAPSLINKEKEFISRRG